MAKRRLRVQHWLACLHCEVQGPAGPDNLYNLFGVGYVREAPADTELPWAFAKMDLFARFLGGTGSRYFEVRVAWLDAPDRPRLLQTFGPFRVAFRPGHTARDVVFRLGNVPVEGIGRLRFRLCELKAWRARNLATEYLTVVRQP